jgi:hypothetical protein
MKTAIIETLSLEQELQQMVVSAPSRANLSTANAKLELLRQQRNEASAAAVALEKQASVGAVEMIERAKELIKKGEVPVLVTPDELRQARQALRIIEGAVQIQEREARSLAACLSGEVRRGLRPFRQRLVVRVAAALKELEAAAKEDLEAVSVVGRAGADAAQVGYLQIPEPMGGAQVWLSAYRSDGYKV